MSRRLAVDSSEGRSPFSARSCNKRLESGIVDLSYRIIRRRRTWDQFTAVARIEQLYDMSFQGFRK